MINRISDGFDFVVQRLGSVGSDSSAANGDEKVRIGLLIGLVARFMMAGTVGGLIYLSSGEIAAAAIVFGYIICALLGIAIFRRRSYALLQFMQLLLVLLTPFLLTVQLGGFAHSGGVILLAICCPLSALVFSGHRESVLWTIAFIALVILSGLLQPLMRTENALSPGLITFLFAANILVVCGIVFSTLFYFLLQRDKALALLKIEREKSENLLLNVLPKEIAAVLKNENGVIAEHFDAVSILFADVANFTPMSAKMTPEAVVTLLNDLFSHFDSLAEKYGLEKIKTIGDCYMVASGVPVSRPDHAQAVANMALEMCTFVAERAAGDDGPLDLRIGIHSGPVVAGVIGRKKFIYDLWGDSVNTASRMESHGIPGKIQITPETYALIRDEFQCEPRGTVMIKGKGEMQTWYLIDHKLTTSVATA